MEQKESWVMYDNWSEIILSFPENYAYHILKYITHYRKTGTKLEEEPEAIRAIAEMMLGMINSNNKKWEQSVEAGRKGAQKRWGTKKKTTDKSQSADVQPKQEEEQKVANIITDFDRMRDEGFERPNNYDILEHIKHNHLNVDLTEFTLHYDGLGWKVNGKYIDWKEKVQEWSDRKDMEAEEEERAYKKTISWR